MVWTQPVVALRFGNRPWGDGTDGGAGGDPSQAGHGPTDVTAGRRSDASDFDLEADFASEASHGCLPRRGALFELSCCRSASTTNEAAEAQDGLPADDGTLEWTRSPGVVPTDTVTRLQRERRNCAQILCAITRGRRRPHRSAHGGPHLRLPKCPSLLV